MDLDHLFAEPYPPPTEDEWDALSPHLRIVCLSRQAARLAAHLRNDPIGLFAERCVELLDGVSDWFGASLPAGGGAVGVDVVVASSGVVPGGRALQAVVRETGAVIGGVRSCGVVTCIDDLPVATMEVYCRLLSKGQAVHEETHDGSSTEVADPVPQAADGREAVGQTEGL